MFKRKKKKGNEAAAELSATVEAEPTPGSDAVTTAAMSEQHSSIAALAVPAIEASSEFAAEVADRQSESEQVQSEEGPTNGQVQRRGQFRSWVVDADRGYARLTDEENRLILLQFSEKPAHEILAAIKSAGFQYKPEHHGQERVWARRNDHQGRLEAEGIEKLVRGISKELEPF